MASLLERMQKAGSIKAEILTDSKFFGAKELTTTAVPIINVAFSGLLDGGFAPGLTVIAGPSKHFKSNLGLISVKAYLDKYKDAVCLFYDSEFGITPEYLEQQGVDGSRVVHIPIEHIEQLKFDISKRLDEIQRGDKVIIFMDSIGNLASKKEVEDALEGKGAADMTRAKQLKSLFRIITPSLTTKEIPCLVINHTYMEQGLYPKAIVSGGTGIMYSASTVFIIGRSQEKGSSGEIEGYNFTINIEKSRYVKEKSKMTFQVTWEGGVQQYSGLLDLALEGKFIVKPKVGWYSAVDPETGELVGKSFREADFYTDDRAGLLLKHQPFADFVRDKYKIGWTGRKEDEEFTEEEMS